MQEECSSVCVVDASGKIVREANVVSEPEALIGWFDSLGLGLARTCRLRPKHWKNELKSRLLIAGFGNGLCC